MARTKGIQVIPSEDDYVIQAHQISRAVYIMPTLQRRLLHLLMAQVQIRQEGFELLEMSTGDIVRALHEADSHYGLVREAVKGLMGQILDIDTPDGWIQFHWVDVARYIKSRDVVQFKVSPELLPYVLEVKEMWRQISVTDMTKLTGKYSIRIFELVMANRGFAGKGGNRSGEWFTDLAFGDARLMFKIGPDEYKRTEAFRRVVLDGPIREINASGIGLRLEANYDFFRRGRNLLGVRIKAKFSRPTEPRNVTPSREEEEEDALLELNRDLYERLLADEPTDLFGGELRRRGNAYQAMLKHPELKKPAPAKTRKAPVVKKAVPGKARG